MVKVGFLLTPWRASALQSVHNHPMNGLLNIKCCESVGPLQGSKWPKNGKRGFRGQKTPISQCPRNGRFESKIPISTGLRKENGDFLTQSAHFWDTGTTLTPKPSFPDFLAILAPVGGRCFRNIRCYKLKKALQLAGTGDPSPCPLGQSVATSSV